MLFASQHSLIIKFLRSQKSGGAIAPLAPLFRRPCIYIIYIYIYIYIYIIIIYIYIRMIKN